tara:strand:- start:162 stop:422 length:261 start_codon:yes stop_codon:yes gene_type:complete
MNSKVWYMYVVECADGTLYTGITNNLERRINEHNFSMRGAKYTRSRRPVKLLYTEGYETHSKAASAEWKFKKLKRSEKLRIIGEGR